MGYSTQFKGKLLFNRKLTSAELRYLDSVLLTKGYHGKKIPKRYEELENKYIDFKISSDKKGLNWNNAEKTYNMPQIIKFLVRKVCVGIPDFALNGQFICQGENVDDYFKIDVSNNIPIKTKLHHEGIKFKCPKCDQEYYIKYSKGQVKISAIGY